MFYFHVGHRVDRESKTEIEKKNIESQEER